MTEKTTIRLFLAIKAHYKWITRHFDISSAYIHEPHTQYKPVYIRENPRFNGELRHLHHTGIILRNLYGTPPAAQTYLKGLISHLVHHVYTKGQNDQFLFSKLDENEPILVAIRMVDLLPMLPSKRSIDELLMWLATKYKISNRRFPTTYLKWHIIRTPEGHIHLSHPHVA